jgi:hypothetical protein
LDSSENFIYHRGKAVEILVLDLDQASLIIFLNFTVEALADNGFFVLKRANNVHEKLMGIMLLGWKELLPY